MGAPRRHPSTRQGNPSSLPIPSAPKRPRDLGCREAMARQDTPGNLRHASDRRLPPCRQAKWLARHLTARRHLDWLCASKPNERRPRNNGCDLLCRQSHDPGSCYQQAQASKKALQFQKTWKSRSLGKSHLLPKQPHLLSPTNRLNLPSNKDNP